MTVDELRKIYDDAFTPIVTSATCADSEFANVIAEAERAGIRAVVTALRDEIGNPTTFVSAKPECCGRGVPNYKDGSEECCCQPDVWLLHEELLERINEILARGDEVAGGSTPGERLVKAAHEAAAIARGEKEPAAVHTPAAAPDDVCVWLDDGNPRKRRKNSCGLQGANQSWAGMHWVCTGCLKTIKFVEAAR